MRLGRNRWLLAIVAVLLVAEGVARVLGGHIAAIDQRGHPELERKWTVLGERADGPADGRPQVVAFGNSMMDGGFVPSAFAATPGGASAYNAAFLNAPLVTIARWANMVIDRVDPAVAIVMIHPLDTIEGNVSFGQDGGTLATSFEDALATLEPGPFERMTERAESLSALIRYRATLRQPPGLWQALMGAVHGDPRPEPQRIDEAAPLHEIDWTTALDADGWNTRFTAPGLAPDAVFPLGFVGALTTEATFDSGPVRSVLDALSAAPRAVMVIPPVATEILDRSGIPAAVMAARAEELIEIAREEGVEVVDLSGADYPTTLFHDPVHLAREGAERFSRDLATALAR